MAVALSTPITKSPFPAKPTPAAKPPPAPKPPAKPAAKPTPLTKPITAPIVATSHPALEPKPVGPKVTTPAHGGASSRLPKKTSGVEPHAKLPPVPAPASSPIGSAVAGSQVALPKKVVATQKREMAQGNTGVKVVKSVVSDVPKELAGKGVIVSAGRSAIKAGAGLAGGLAQDVIGSAAKSSGAHLPALIQRQAVASVQADVPKELKGKGVLTQGLAGIAQSTQKATSLGIPSSYTSREIQAAGLGGPSIAKVLTTTAKNAVIQAVDFPAAAPTSIWDTGMAGIQAFEGNTKPAEQMMSALGQSVTPAGLEAAPLTAFFMGRGGLTAVGGVARRITDAAGVTDSAARAGYMGRPDHHLVAKLYDPVKPWSRNPVRYAEQKIGEMRPIAQLSRLARTRSLTERPPLNPPLVERLPAGGFFGSGYAAGLEHRVRTLAAENVDQWEHMRRDGKRKVSRVAMNAITASRGDMGALGRQFKEVAVHPQELISHPKIHGVPSISLLGQLGITKPSQIVPAFEKELARLDPTRTKLQAKYGIKPLPPETETQLQEARQHVVASIETALNHNEWLKNPQPSIDAARTLAKFQQQEHTPVLEEQGQLYPGAAAEARWVPFASSEMNLERTRQNTEAMDRHLTWRKAREKVGEARVELAAAVRAHDPERMREAESTLTARETTAKVLEVPYPKGNEKEIVFRHRETGAVHSLQQIKDYADSLGRAEPLLVTHRPYLTRAGATGGKASEIPLAESKLRTGDAWLRGLHDPSYEHLVSHLLNERRKINAHNSGFGHIDAAAIFNQHPTTGRNEGYFNNPSEVRAAMDKPFFKEQNPHGLDIVPARVGAQFIRQHQLRTIKDSLTPIEDLYDPMTQEPALTTEDEVAKDQQDTGQWVGIPYAYINTVKAYERPAEGFQRFARGLTTQFRRSALATSAHRIGGLPVENFVFRGVPAHAGPMAFRAAKKVEGRLTSPELNTPERVAAMGQTGIDLWHQIESRAITGQQAGQAIRERTFSRPGIAELPKNTPVVGHLIHLYTTAADAIIAAEKAATEGTFQRTLAGKWLMDEMKISPLEFGQALKMQGRAFDDFLQQLGTIPEGRAVAPSVLALTRFVDKYGGRYGKLQPGTQNRMWMTPFGLWYVNALKFTFATLPVDHPIITGLLAAADTATQPQRKKQGLLGPLATGINELVRAQQGSQPFSPTQSLQQQYYSNFGAVNDLFATPFSMILPQITTAMNVVQGNNWYGGKLTSPGMARGAELSAWDTGMLLVQTMADSAFPIEKLQTLLTGGQPQYGTSTIVNPQPYPDSGPPDVLKAVEKLLNPLKVQTNRLASGDHPTSSSGGAGGGGAGGGGAGGGGAGGGGA